MDLQITLIGLNHKTASVDVRERFALADFCSPENWALPPGGDLRESLILSTCNRVELIGIATANARLQMLEHWTKARSESLAELERYIYVYHDQNAIRHIFEVASSLDSMVLGEPQILGQLKEAYRKAVRARAAGAILNRMMHKAFYVAKRVRNETAVAASAVSISYAAVELAKRIFGNMPGHKALLIGAGEMAELAAAHLLHAGIDKIYVCNRTYAHAQELAAKFQGEALPFENLADHFKNVDIVIASTGSPDPVVGLREVKTALAARKNRPMFFIDIAVPRDIDPQINTLDNIYLYDIDDLKEVVEENMAGRKEEAARARLIVDEEVENFSQWLQSLDAQPTILDLIKRGEDACAAELARAMKKLGPLSPGQKEVVEKMAFSICRKLNHDPIMFLKDKEPGHADPLARINMVRRIFNLDKNGRGH